MSEFGTGNLLKISFKLVSTDDKLTSLIGFKTPNSTPSNKNKVSVHEGKTYWSNLMAFPKDQLTLYLTNSINFNAEC